MDFSALRVTFAGGMALQPVVAARWKEVTGNTMAQGWGLTETSPIVTANPIGLPFNGSVGLPVSSTDVSIRDDAGAETARQRRRRDLRIRTAGNARLLEPAGRNRTR